MSKSLRDPWLGIVNSYFSIKRHLILRSRSVDDVELVARTIIGKRGVNYMPAPLPYRDVVLPSKLRFGFYTTGRQQSKLPNQAHAQFVDKFIKASPACARAVLETVEALRREGHECTEIDLPERNKAPQSIPNSTTHSICLATRAIEIFASITSADGYSKLLSHLGPDPKVCHR